MIEPLKHCERLHIPAKVFALVWTRQNARCPCGADLTSVQFAKHHEPPLGLRPEDADANDPERIQLLCLPCHDRRTPQDISDIAKAFRVSRKQAEHLTRMAEKYPGRPYQKRSKIRSRGFR